MHIHSDISDGSDGIDLIVDMAKDKGLDAIVITDHDTLEHMSQVPDDAGILVGAGVEISAIHRGEMIQAHILGYNIKTPEIVTAVTQPLLEARNLNSEKQAQILISHGFNINMDKLSRAAGKYLYKQHILDWLVSTGQITEMFGEFYKTTFKNGGICDFSIEYVEAVVSVTAIKDAGGLAVLAHPGQQQNFHIISELVSAGLDGLELHHHSHSESDRDIIRQYAHEYGLFLAGGSDYHGRFESRAVGIGDILSENSGASVVFAT